MATAPLTDRMIALVKHSQFIWWVGHVITLITALFYYLSVMTFRPNPTYYYRAYLASLVSYFVVVYHSYKVPQFNLSFARRFLADENVQYLFLAFYWYSTSPIFVTLIPFATFSVFHTLGYIRSNVLPTFFPSLISNRTSAGPNTAQTANFPSWLVQAIKQLTDKHYAPAMRFVAVVEVCLIMGTLILGAITFQTSFLAPILYAHFLRLRYFMNPYVRNTFHEVGAHLDKLLLPPTADPRIPPVIGKIYSQAKTLIVRYAQSAIQQPQNQSQPGR
ncbi:uncharacterized protein VTP21DRAFT_2382 [Calcarisporiella thermophila]|uniref:uncharacterized protein n=1 Tax=Calcarisporiella thermophila TaxID=911321 RepID=UPI0037433839